MAISVNGIIYNWFIDPLLRGAQGRIVGALRPGDRVLDIACGTGSLSMAMAGVAGEVRGIDLSDEMIGYATETARKREIKNVSFGTHDASDLSLFNDMDFNVAVTSMAIHQFDASLAVDILREMKRIAPRVIIMDYNYPLQKGFARSAVHTVEWIAGGDHWRNFLEYNRIGGLDWFLSEAGLAVSAELYGSSAFRVVEYG